MAANAIPCSSARVYRGAGAPGAILVLASLLPLLALGLGGCGKSEQEKKVEAAKVEAQTTGRLLVKSNRPNATVEARRISPAADSAAATTGVAGQPLAGLLPGKYAVLVRTEGWPELRREADVAAGGTAELAADFPAGSLRLDSLPTGATVRLGETVLGRTPLVVPQLPPGECTLVLDYPAWPALTVKVAIAENTEAAQTVRLPHGRLIVESAPAGATVYFGKRPLGQTPLTIERFQAGKKSLTLQAKDFPPLETTFTIEDGGELKIRPVLAKGYPLLDPAELLRLVWWEPPPDDPNRLSPTFDPFPGFHPQNGVVRNLNRKKLFETWLGRKYRFTGKVKTFNRDTGQIEFAEQANELSKYRVLAQLSAAARGDAGLAAQLAGKDVTFALYGRLSAVEESERRGRPITLEFGSAEPVPDGD